MLDALPVTYHLVSLDFLTRKSNELFNPTE
jgi:hypothetical protein